nr:ImmA/IrrE family metallo-endopeptidase [uncultured Hyphomonas sp.]
MSKNESEAFRAPEPSNLNKSSVHKIAESVAKQLKYNYDGNVKSVVEGIGGSVHIKNFWTDRTREDGSLEVRSKNDFSIYVPNDTSPLRDTFTIAHELGHYVLHYLWPQQVKGEQPFLLRATRYGSDRAEWEANWFASAFLMPEAEFKSAARRKSIGQLAEQFGVSRQAASIRAKALSLDVDD